MKKFYIILFFIFVLFLAIPLTKVYAAGSISLGGASTATTGSNFTININVSGATFGTAGGTLKFDSSKVEFVSATGTFNSSTGKFAWTDYNGKSSGTIISVTFKAKVAGSAAFSISGQEGADTNGAELNPSGGSKTVTISDPVAKSSNAYLKALSTTPSGMTPAFKKDVYTYSLTVGADVTEVKISATKEDSNAKYNVTGNKDLKAGANTIKVTVTAEDGKTKKTYTINVTKEGDGDAQDPVAEEVALGLKSLAIKDIDFLPIFDKSVNSYVCQVGPEVEKLEITAIPDPEDATIEINGNEELKTGENIITILVKKGEEVDTYQITVNKIESINNTEEDNNQAGIDKDIQIKTWIVIGSILGIIVVTSGLNIILYIENMKLSEGIPAKKNTREAPELKYQSFTDETDFGNGRNKRGKHS